MAKVNLFSTIETNRSLKKERFLEKLYDTSKHNTIGSFTVICSITTFTARHRMGQIHFVSQALNSKALRVFFLMKMKICTFVIKDENVLMLSTNMKFSSGNLKLVKVQQKFQFQKTNKTFVSFVVDNRMQT